MRALALLAAFLALPVLADELPDYCGSGPVEIEVEREVDCPVTPPPPPRPEGSRDTGYRFPLETGSVRLAIPDPTCWRYDGTQQWTDYPECGGELVGEPR